MTRHLTRIGLVFSILIGLSVPPVLAQTEQLSGSVVEDVFQVGTQGNEIIFVVANDGDELLADVRAVPVFPLQWLDVTAITPGSTDIPAGGSAEFTISFSVRADAPVGQGETLTVYFGPGGEPRDAQYALRATFGAKTEEDEDDEGITDPEDPDGPDLPTELLAQMRALADEAATVAEDAAIATGIVFEKLAAAGTQIDAAAATATSVATDISAINADLAALDSGSRGLTTLHQQATEAGQIAGAARDQAISAADSACLAVDQIAQASLGEHQAILARTTAAAATARSQQLIAAEAAANALRAAGTLNRVIGEIAALQQRLAQATAELDQANQQMTAAESPIADAISSFERVRAVTPRLAALRAQADTILATAQGILAPLTRDDLSAAPATAMLGQFNALHAQIVSHATGQSDETVVTLMSRVGEMAADISGQLEALNQALAAITPPVADATLRESAGFAAEFAAARGSDAQQAAARATACLEQVRSAASVAAQTGYGPAEAAVQGCDFAGAARLIEALPEGPRRAGLEAQYVSAYDNEQAALAQVQAAAQLQRNGDIGGAIALLRQARATPPCLNSIPPIDQAIDRLTAQLSAEATPRVESPPPLPQVPPAAGLTTPPDPTNEPEEEPETQPTQTQQAATSTPEPAADLTAQQIAGPWIGTLSLDTLIIDNSPTTPNQLFDRFLNQALAEQREESQAEDESLLNAPAAIADGIGEALGFVILLGIDIGGQMLEEGIEISFALSQLEDNAYELVIPGSPETETQAAEDVVQNRLTTTDGHNFGLATSQDAPEGSASLRIDFIINEDYSSADLSIELVGRATSADVPGGIQSGAITFKGSFVPGSISYEAMEAAIKRRAEQLFIVEAQKIADILGIDPPEL